MANRLTRITTRTGDDGSTGLGDGTRVQKSAARVQVMGDLDELNSAIGVVLTEQIAPQAGVKLTRIQNQLFDLGGELCIPGHRAITSEHVVFLDQATADLNASLPSLKEFVLPGGVRAAALCHVARTIARRAERNLVSLRNQETISAESMQYLNRLSDFLFVLARALNRDAGRTDVLWQREAGG
jgi:cob(I)alamin adenosyltransferase